MISYYLNSANQVVKRTADNSGSSVHVVISLDSGSEEYAEYQNIMALVAAGELTIAPADE